MKAFLTKFFLPQRKLEQVIVDLPELMARPAAMLARNDVRIGTINPAALVLSCVLLGFFAPMKFAHSWDWSTEGIGLAVGAGLGMLLWYFIPHYEIRLTADGVVFQRGHQEVFCPWALFNAAGNPLLLNAWQLTLPVSTAAAPYVELHQDEYCRAQGAEVKTRFFRFRAHDTLWLRYLYEAEPMEVGELLLRLGRMLGTRSPSGWAPPEAHPAEEIQPAAVGIAGADGSITLRLTRLVLPSVCCACGQATNQWRNFPVSEHPNILLVILTLGHLHENIVNISIPMCVPCQDHFRRTTRRGVWLGLSAGLMLAFLLGMLALTLKIGNNPIEMFVLALIIGPLLGWGVGLDLAKWRSSPIRSARYSSRRGTVRLRFRRAEYAELAAECVRAMEKRNGKE